MSVECRQLRITNFKVEHLNTWGTGVFTGKEGDEGSEAYIERIKIQTFLQDKSLGVLVEGVNSYSQRYSNWKPLELHGGFFPPTELVPATPDGLHQALVKLLAKLAE